MNNEASATVPAPGVERSSLMLFLADTSVGQGSRRFDAEAVSNAEVIVRLERSGSDVRSSAALRFQFPGFGDGLLTATCPIELDRSNRPFAMNDMTGRRFHLSWESRAVLEPLVAKGVDAAKATMELGDVVPVGWKAARDPWTVPRLE